jgi:hypothetical protein
MLVILPLPSSAKRSTKILIVFAGYALAVAAGIIAAMIYDWGFSPADQQASGGMIAFAELMFGAGVFALLSVPPTALALWFARRHRRTWGAFTIACLAFALAGVVAVVALLTASLTSIRTPAIALLSVFGVAQMLGSPIWISSFALLAALAPERDLRRRLLVATAIEIGIGICALVHFGPAFGA